MSEKWKNKKLLVVDPKIHQTLKIRAAIQGCGVNELADKYLEEILFNSSENEKHPELESEVA